MNITSAADTMTHAVSPESIFTVTLPFGCGS